MEEDKETGLSMKTIGLIFLGLILLFFVIKMFLSGDSSPSYSPAPNVDNYDISRAFGITNF